MSVKVNVIEVKMTLTSKVIITLLFIVVLTLIFIDKNTHVSFYKVNLVALLLLPLLWGIRSYFVKEYIVVGALYFTDQYLKIQSDNNNEKIIFKENISYIKYSLGDIEYVNRFGIGVSNKIIVRFEKKDFIFRVNLTSKKQQKEIVQQFNSWSNKGMKIFKI